MSDEGRYRIEAHGVWASLALWVSLMGRDDVRLLAPGDFSFDPPHGASK